jgi:hypothetical protein
MGFFGDLDFHKSLALDRLRVKLTKAAAPGNPAPAFLQKQNKTAGKQR